MKFFLKLFISCTDRTLPNYIKIRYVILLCDVRTVRHEFFYALFFPHRNDNEHLLLVPCTSSVFEPYTSKDTTVISP
jgi:hypothetical protein